MAGSRKLEIIIAGDAKGATDAFKETEGGLSKLGDGIKNFAKVAAVGLVAAGAGVAVFAKSAIGAASDLSETISKSNTIFGENAKAIDDWSKTAATRLGQSRKEALDAAATFGNLFVQLGVNTKKAGSLSTAMVELASDFASFHNANPPDVIEAMTAAFRGEYDAVQRYVPTINAATVEQKALEMTGKKTTKMLTAQDKALATQELLYKGAGAALGDFGRTSDGLANKQRILKARFADLQAEIGTALIPIAVKLGDLLMKLVPVFTTLSRAVVDGVQVMISAFRNPQAPWEDASPFVKGMATVGHILRSVFDWMRENIPPVLRAIAGFIQTQVIPAIQQLAGWVRDDLQPAIGKMVDSFMQDLWPAIDQKVIPALKRLAEWIRDEVLPQLGKIVTYIFTDLLPALFKVAAWIIEELIPTLARITMGFWAFLGEVRYVADQMIDKFSGLGSKLAAPFLEAKRAVDDFLDRLDFIPDWAKGSLLDLEKKVPGPRIGWSTSLVDLINGKRASGGPVGAGGTYVVGERGPELLHMGRGSGNITPNRSIGGGGQAITLNIDGRSFMTWLVDYSRDAGGIPITTRSPS